MNVLILDDDRINLKLFSHMLKGVGGVTTVALEDPVQALAWCGTSRPDLVLLCSTH